MKALWLSLAALVCLSAAAFAEVKPTRIGYNRANELRISGTVVEVRDITRAGTPNGTYLMLKTPTETLSVHLGPSLRMKKDRLMLSPGDAVEVVGCLVTPGKSTILLAREVHKAGKVVTFRNARGFPRFSPRPAL